MGKIEMIPEGERPREKALMYGVSSLSNRELIAILVRVGPKGSGVLDVADQVLKKAGGVGGLGTLSLTQLKQIRGISDVHAVELQACLELSRRVGYEKARKADAVHSPEAVYEWLKRELGDCPQENFMVLYLDTAGRIAKARKLFVGTYDQSLVSPRDVFREAKDLLCTRIMLVHNHPSGQLEPSTQDLRVTERIVEAGKLLDIKVLDHLIVSDEGVFSFRREGLLS